MKKSLCVLALLGLSLQGIYQARTIEIPTRAVPYGYVESLSHLGTAPAETDVWSPMVSPVNALVMSMAERECDYNLEDEYFIWNSLYYVIGLYGTQDWRMVETDDIYLVPREMVEDYAFAMFGFSENLPYIPYEMIDFIQYDDESEVYHWQKGDASLTDSRLLSLTDMGEGKNYFTGEFFALENNLVIWYFQGVLVENESMFGYSIDSFAIEPVIFVN